jgi:UDP-galactopyranose mutase
LVTRLGERKVRLELGAEVTALLVTGGRVSGVTLADGTERRADVVVAAIDARTVFGRLLPHGLNLPGRRLFGAATPAIPPSVTHVGLHGDVPALPDEVVLHGDPLLVLTTCGSAPPDGHAWTVQRRGDAQEDVLVVLARRGIDVRDHVVTRLDRSADDLVRETGGSPYGLAWPGWRAHVRRAAQSNPVPGLHLCGSSVHPGPGVPYVAWGAAHIATRIGPVQP